ncbi:MAG TPA: mannose-6-phosphate isomerase, class I, partial [Polyangiaceae bacterium]|nr:mannose-6-phosphate isomerase, class I [Polyangiaceae bacterium]
MNFSPLLCKIQRYAWGSRSFIASLQGRPTPSDEPEAELWVGAHPSAPAEVVEGETQSRLDVLIARAPERALGTDVARRFHDELPFLMKVLAAAEPLSLQAHPSRAQAEQGFAQEQAAGIRLDAPTRSYKDARPKPELIVALTPFVALSGFRPLERTLRLIAELSIPELTGLFGPLHAGTGLAADGAEARLARVFDRLINSEAAERDSLVRSVRVRAAELAPQSKEFARELRWVERLYTLYPGDIGVVISLLLNHVELAPFQGLYLPPGNLHAYLDGAGVE